MILVFIRAKTAILKKFDDVIRRIEAQRALLCEVFPATWSVASWSTRRALP
jgi:hypothetical protein